MTNGLLTEAMISKRAALMLGSACDVRIDGGPAGIDMTITDVAAGKTGVVYLKPLNLTMTLDQFAERKIEFAQAQQLRLDAGDHRSCIDLRLGQAGCTHE